MTYQQPYKGKQTVCKHEPNALALTEKGLTHYVSTYNGESWKQTDCRLANVERVKAEHLADSKFMERACTKS